ncbi:MAG: PCYCGC domain-containing protein, partial [Gemmatimonadetes bacterium]|nr:PCYCGC domain-containing protein [Gemmatimonadota bacterium]
CECAEHSGHYSLLDCFASDHGARCDICLSEATIAYQMTMAGESLDAVRKEIDSQFRS